ncbi:hypothetical protein [Rhizorhabdus sp. FW153]|uniref:hypothetical protein n=1 Tax=Rhizorhabdus sp. FW153 TaxID=3400216 RepID=UPI003CF98795
MTSARKNWLWAPPIAAALLLSSISDAYGAEPGRSEAEAAVAPADIPPKEAALVRAGKVSEARRLYLRRTGKVRKIDARSEAAQRFALFVYRESPALSDETGAIILDLLQEAVDGFRLSLGVDAPEVATALMQRAEVERLLNAEDPAAWTDIAYQQAYRIRYARLGPSAPETLAALISLAEIQALPSRVGDDPASVESVADVLRQVMLLTRSASDEEALALRQDAERALARLESRYGGQTMRGRRPRIAAAQASAACPAASLQDSIVLSGETAGLQGVRTRFRKAGLDLQPCGALLIFPLGPGTDPTPVLGILSDISAGRVPGVTIGLSGAPVEAPSPALPPRP